MFELIEIVMFTYKTTLFRRKNEFREIKKVLYNLTLVLRTIELSAVDNTEL